MRHYLRSPYHLCRDIPSGQSGLIYPKLEGLARVVYYVIKVKSDD